MYGHRSSRPRRETNRRLKDKRIAILDLAFQAKHRRHEKLLNCTGEIKIALKAHIAYLTVFAVAVPILTWLLGLPGLITANLLAYLTLTLSNLFLAHRKFNVFMNIKEQTRIYIASVLSTLPVLAFIHVSPFSNIPNLLACAALYITTYLTLTLILKAINHEDPQNLKTNLHKNRTENTTTKNPPKTI